jgi:FkbM family methyltransferase
MLKHLGHLGELIRRTAPDLKFTILEIGALQIGGNPEPFYQILDLFAGSRIISFEVEESVCDKMNAQAKAGVHYYPVALGERNEKSPFYVTQHPMCSSLYEPNEPLISLYNNLEVSFLRHKTQIDTVSLDHFAQKYDIGAVDFIKIDIQGAELDVFKGGKQTLKDVLAIVCEVEFVPMYNNQPLFGDVCAFLQTQNLMFHKFLGLAGRALKPIVINKNPNSASQHFWSDAVYVRHVQTMQQLSTEQLLKLGVLACVYGSPDLTYYCLAQYDAKQGSTLAGDFMRAAVG